MDSRQKRRDIEDGAAYRHESGTSLNTELAES